MQMMECGAKDVIWIGRQIRVFITSRLEDRTFFMVTVPNGMAPGGVDRLVISAPANGRRMSHVFSLYSGESFYIGGATVRLEDVSPIAEGATPLRDRLLHIDAPPGWAVTRDSGAHRGARAAARKRAEG